MITPADHTTPRGGARPRWLYPALAVAAVAAALLYLGVLTPSSLLTIALFGGMIGMHLFGHGGHGGHGGQGGHGGHDEAPTPPASPEDDNQAPHRGCH